MKDDNKANIDANSIIVVDADYLEEVTGNMQSDFEKHLGRQFGKADLAQWTECVALDGGLEPGDNKTAVIMFHDKNRTQLYHYVPSVFDSDLNDRAFRDNLGEFVYTSIPVDNNALRGEMLSETITVMGAEKTVERITVVADAAKYGSCIDKGLEDFKKKNGDKQNVCFTAVTMHHRDGWSENQVMLGFSIMHTLGITDDDLKKM